MFKRNDLFIKNWEVGLECITIIITYLAEDVFSKYYTYYFIKRNIHAQNLILNAHNSFWKEEKTNMLHLTKLKESLV